MNVREWQKLAKEHLLPYFSDLTLSGHWLLYTPIGWQARGFAFEPSGFDKLQFTVYAGLLPLYVPQSVGETFCERIGWLAKRKQGDIWWNLGLASADEVFTDIRQRIQQDGIPYLQQRATVEAMTKIRQHQIIHLSADSYVYQAMLCAGILLNDASRVEREWKNLLNYRQRYPKEEMQNWEIEFYQVTEDIYRQFHTDPAVARNLIAHYRQERAAEWRLTAFLVDEPGDLRDAAHPRLRWFGRKG